MLNTNEMPQLSEAHLRTLWARMTEIYGHRWTKPHGMLDTHNTWLKGLVGFTPRMIAHGLEACVVRSDAYPPSLPEFRALCLGLPNRDETVYIAVRQIHNHDNRVANMIRNIIGAHDMDNMTYDKLEKRAKDVYPEAVERLTRFMLQSGVANLRELTHVR